MVRRRIWYGGVMLAAVLFLVFYDGYLAFYLCTCVLLAPLLSLLLLLPAAFQTRIRMCPGSTRYCRGQPGEWQIRFEKLGWFPVRQLTLLAVSHNEWTGDEVDSRYSFSKITKSQALVFPMDTSHCGAMTARLNGIRVVDCLGLFALPLRPVVAGPTFILPPPTSPEEIPAFDFSHIHAVPGRGASVDPEDYELRNYRAGDPLRAVHWKLSSKWDTLLVKDHRGQHTPSIIIDFFCFGAPDMLDQALEQLQATSTGLLQCGYAHVVQWVTAGGEQAAVEISTLADLRLCMERIISRRAPEHRPPDQESPHFDPPAVRIEVSPKEEVER